MNPKIDIDYSALAEKFVKELYYKKHTVQKSIKDLIQQFINIANESKIKEKERCAGIAFDHNKKCSNHGPCIADEILNGFDEDLDNN